MTDRDLAQDGSPSAPRSQTDSKTDELRNLRGILAAIDRVQAVIEFALDGTILTANANFLHVLGYRLDEIQGKHHSMFVDPSYSQSSDYKSFWRDLNLGKFFSAEYKRIGKGGKEVWIQASYNPVLDEEGKPTKVVKFATDITEQKLVALNSQRQIDEMTRTRAVVEFSSEGQFITANHHFMSAMGYKLDELRGQHHSLFVDSETRTSSDYRQFWRDLNDGKFLTGEFKRIGKGGREVWLQATYNPVFDINGRVSKVIKYAIDISARKEAERAFAELTRQTAEQERAQAEASQREAHVLSQALGEATRVLSSIAAGDLTVQMQGAYTGNLATLQEGLAQTLQTLTNMVTQIRDASYRVAHASSEIASASFDLSRRTEAQAANLEETAATAEELTSIVRQNAEKAQNAANLANANRLEAAKGAKVVRRTVEVMGSIKESSKTIADIIGTVDEIAFQTNILALNAAVEAARAGDQGRGFAVVAAEVRNLAQRSAAAAKEIKQLIRSSVERVDEGSRAVAESGQVLEEIERSAESVSQLIQDMAISSQEQFSGVEQVSAAVIGLEQVTQQNAAMVEETVASADALDTQANVLRELMAFFHTGDTEQQVDRRARATASASRW